MQFTSLAAFLAITIVGVAAVPGYHPPPPPPKPSAPSSINLQNTCNSGAPYCCSPSNGGSGTTCVGSQTQCNTVLICCNNNADGSSVSSQSCTGSNTLQQPVTFV